MEYDSIQDVRKDENEEINEEILKYGIYEYRRRHGLPTTGCVWRPLTAFFCVLEFSHKHRDHPMPRFFLTTMTLVFLMAAAFPFAVALRNASYTPKDRREMMREQMEKWAESVVQERKRLDEWMAVNVNGTGCDICDFRCHLYDLDKCKAYWCDICNPRCHRYDRDKCDARTAANRRRPFRGFIFGY